MLTTSRAACSRPGPATSKGEPPASACPRCHAASQDDADGHTVTGRPCKPGSAPHGTSASGPAGTEHDPAVTQVGAQRCDDLVRQRGRLVPR